VEISGKMFINCIIFSLFTFLIQLKKKLINITENTCLCVVRYIIGINNQIYKNKNKISIQNIFLNSLICMNENKQITVKPALKGTSI